MILGKELKPGMTVKVLGADRVITRITRRQIPARILHDSVAAKHPEGLPGGTLYFVPMQDRVGSCTFFDDEHWEEGSVL